MTTAVAWGVWAEEWGFKQTGPIGPVLLYKKTVLTYR